MTDGGDRRALGAARVTAAGASGAGTSVARAIIDVTRDLARTVPPPRGAPYFCLDSEVPYDLRVLDAFCSRGIFRKYELALELGSGLGGRARWLAARSGCRIVGIDPRPQTVAAAALLNRRARMDDQVSFCVGGLDSLPLRQRVFTHVWVVGPMYQTGAAQVFADAFRVLRPGAHFALHDPVGPRAHCDEVTQTLREVGFVELEVCESPLVDLPHAYRVAYDRLRRVSQEPASRPLREHACWQIFARRPA